jgi:Ca2+-binding EF-hand superfamily protein
MLDKYDADKSGNLDPDELTQLLAHHDHGVKSDWNEYHTGMVTTNIGSVTPTAEEISWLMKAGAKRKQNRVDVSEIGYILDLWHSYVMNRAKIEEVFSKFDTDHNQNLDFEEVKKYLTELNEGHAPKVTVDVQRRHAPPCASGCGDICPQFQRVLLDASDLYNFAHRMLRCGR